MQRGHRTGLERRGQKNHGQPIRVIPDKPAPEPARESWWLGKSREALNAEARARRFSEASKHGLAVNTRGILNYD